VRRISAAGSGTRVFVFYEEGPLISLDGDAAAESAKTKTYVQSWDGSAWSSPQTFAPVVDALSFDGRIWALSDGGYRVSGDGASWSALQAKPEWKEPFACVLSNRLHVYYPDGNALLETEFDGSSWSAPRAAAEDWNAGADAFWFRSRPEAAVIAGRIHVLRLETAGRNTELIDRAEEDGRLGSKSSLGPASSFRVLEASGAVHLFYAEPAPPKTEGPAAAKPAAKGKSDPTELETEHRVHDGAAWSAPETIVSGPPLALAAARTDDGLWLFGSAYESIHFQVRRAGAWSSPRLVSPGAGAPWTPKTATVSMSFGSPARQWGIVLIVFGGLFLCFGLVVWGASALVEARKPVAVDAAAGRLRCASLLRRAAAQVLDFALLGLVLGVFSLAAFALTGGSRGGSAGERLLWGLTAALAKGALVFGYFLVGEAAWGRTPGKSALGIRVVRTDGSPCAWSAAAIRNVLRVVDGIGFYGVGALVFAFGAAHQRVGDLAAGTLVVRDEAGGTAPAAAAQAAAPDEVAKIADFLRLHRAQYGLEALKKSLLSEGYPESNIDEAVRRLPPETKGG
jgi:uncharacterized RDD family membrane protein YckC